MINLDPYNVGYLWVGLFTSLFGIVLAAGGTDAARRRFMQTTKAMLANHDWLVPAMATPWLERPPLPQCFRA